MAENCTFQELFNIIENEGCMRQHTCTITDSGITVHRFVSRNGNTSEQIIDDGDPIERETVLDHLERLEIFHVAVQLFPPDEIDEIDEFPENENQDKIE
jgi:hypothetical protein